LKREAAEFNRYSIRLWVVLSLTISLSMMAIVSKKHFANFWVYVAVVIVSAFLALYFKNRIVLLGPFGYATVLIVALGAALLFGT
jgi:hypothetical protein